MMSYRFLIIIESSFLPTALALTEQHFGYTAEEAAQAWPVMGSTNGAPPPVYHWNSAEFTEQGVSLLRTLAAQFPTVAQVFEYDFDTDPDFPELKRLQMGIQPIVSTDGAPLFAPPR